MAYEHVLTPRCGKPMTWFELPGREAKPEGTVCWRPKNHPGACKSRESLTRARAILYSQRRDRYALLRAAGFSHPEAQYACASAVRFNQAIREAA